MKIHLSLFCLIPLLFLFLIIPSCDPVTHSVFRAVIEDVAEMDYGLDNRITILGMSGNGSNYFLAAATSLWIRPVGTESIIWKEVNPPVNTELCTAFAYNGTDIFTGFKFTDNSFGLYRGILDEDPGWLKIEDTNIIGRQVTGLWSMNSTIFANVMFVNAPAGTTYSLFYYNGTNFMATDLIDSAYPVSGMCFDGTNYWALTKNVIYYSSSASAFTAYPTIPAKETNDSFTGIYYSSQNTFYVSLSNGRIYSAANPPATWTDSGEKLSNTKKVYFTNMAEINSNFLVGTMNLGFYQAAGGDITQVAEFEEEPASDIHRSSILGFYVDAGSNLLFILTGGYGLYRIGYTVAGGWSLLTHE